MRLNVFVYRVVGYILSNFNPFMILVGSISFTGLTATTWADNWPQFRGHGGQGLTSEKRLPVRWGAAQNIAWKVEIPGAGWSSPIVWQDKVFITTAVADNQDKPKPDFGIARPNPEIDQPPDVVYRWMLLCFDRTTGKKIWERVALEGKPRIPTHADNTYASETPATDGTYVYAYFGMTGLFCYDVDGKVIWKKDLGHYRMNGPGWGTGSSPIVDDQLLFVQCDNDEQSFLVALDKKTGDEKWRIDRPDETSNYSTPLIWRNKLRKEMVIGGKTIHSFDPSTGKVLWKFYNGGYCWCASPTADDERVYLSAAGAERGMFALRAGCNGEVKLAAGKASNQDVVWSHRRSASRATPLVYQGFLYSIEQNGRLTCFNAKTGDIAYEGRHLPNALNCYSSPWAYDGKVFFISGDDGNTYVMNGGPRFDVLRENPLNEMMWATPAISDGMLIMRGVDHLYGIKR